MALIFFLVIALGVGAGFLWTLQEMIFKGKWSYFIFFLSAFLPFYITSLSVIFLATRSPEILGIFQILKEVVVLVAVLIFIFFQKRIFEYPFRLQSTDWMMLGFLCLGFLYLLLPLGQASFLNKALYYKSMLIPGFVYFLGRNTRFDEVEIGWIFKIIFAVAIGAFAVNLVENYLLQAHLQQYTGYALYNQVINDIDPTGNFDLTWTFETTNSNKRLASFFSDPLELASSVLMGFAAGLIYFLTSKKRIQLALFVDHGFFPGEFGFFSFQSCFWRLFHHDLLCGAGVQALQTDRCWFSGAGWIWDLCVRICF